MGNVRTAYPTAATSSALCTDFEDKLNEILRVFIVFSIRSVFSDYLFCYNFILKSISFLL